VSFDDLPIDEQVRAAARRQFEEHVRRLQGTVKHHAGPAQSLPPED
jgi:hypothetical protein